MAKKTRHTETPTPRNVMIVMIAGGLAVVLLLGWALTRSVKRGEPQAAPPASQTVAAAQEPAAPATPSDAEHAAVPRIPADKLKQKIDSGEVTVIDVRDADAFLAAHIPGALHIPLARIEGEVPYLPKGKPIVTYCT